MGRNYFAPTAKLTARRLSLLVPIGVLLTGWILMLSWGIAFAINSHRSTTPFPDPHAKGIYTLGLITSIIGFAGLACASLAEVWRLVVASNTKPPEIATDQQGRSCP